MARTFTFFFLLAATVIYFWQRTSSKTDTHNKKWPGKGRERAEQMREDARWEASFFSHLWLSCRFSSQDEGFLLTQLITPNRKWRKKKGLLLFKAPSRLEMVVSFFLPSLCVNGLLGSSFPSFSHFFRYFPSFIDVAIIISFIVIAFFSFLLVFEHFEGQWSSIGIV